MPIWKIRGSSEWCRCRAEDGEWRGRRRVVLVGVRLAVLVVVAVCTEGRTRWGVNGPGDREDAIFGIGIEVVVEGVVTI